MGLDSSTTTQLKAQHLQHFSSLNPFSVSSLFQNKGDTDREITNSGGENMETAREGLKVPKEGSEYVSRLTVPPHHANVGQSFFERFTLKGIRVDTVEPGYLSCTFKVPLRLTTANGDLSSGAITSLVDEIGAAVVHVEGQPMSVSVDMTISFLSTAKVNDELEINARALGSRGRYSGTTVLLRNKSTGEVIAEGRHSLFSSLASKM